MKTLLTFLLLTAGVTAQMPPFEMAKPGVDVAVVVSDMAKSRHFYGDVLGLKPAIPIVFPLPAGSEMAWYQAGATSIKLRSFAKTPPRVEQGPTAANGIRLMSIFVKDSNAVMKRIRDSGAYRNGVVSDPDGNQIDIISFKHEPPPQAFDGFRIGLTVSDAEKAREFYGKALGLKEQTVVRDASSPGELAYFFEAGSTTIWFRAPKGDRPTRTGGIGDALGIRYFTFIVKDVDATYEAFKTRGVKVTTAPRNLADAARIMLISDPDGNTIEFATLLK